MISYGHLSDFLKSAFLFHIHFSVVICDFLVISSQITIAPMHVPFRIHYRNNLIDKKDSYPISRPPSWDDRNCSYGHQLYPSDPTVNSIKDLYDSYKTNINVVIAFLIVKDVWYITKIILTLLCEFCSSLSVTSLIVTYFIIFCSAH